MKKTIIIMSVLIFMFMVFGMANKVFATEQVLDNETESQLIAIKDKSLKSIEDYKQKYGSDAYGITAYVLNQVRIYSIPICFLGIAIGVVKHYIVGIRKLDTLEKGTGIIVTFVTLLIISQILPLAFAVFVKFGRG